MVRHPRWMAGFLRSRAMRDESLINVFDVSFFGISVDELSRSPLPIHAINFVFIEDENTVLFWRQRLFPKRSLEVELIVK